MRAESNPGHVSSNVTITDRVSQSSQLESIISIHENKFLVDICCNFPQLQLEMASVKKHLPILKLLKESKPVLRQNIIRYSDENLIKTIKECVYNTLKGNIPLKKSEISKLKTFKKVLRKIFRYGGRLKKTRKIIIQSGGAFLPTLLSPIVTAGEYHFNPRKQNEF